MCRGVFCVNLRYLREKMNPIILCALGELSGEIFIIDTIY
jgi:hypothetical protein